jgi:hypothetical protein
MTEDNQPSFRLPSVSRKKIPAAFDVVRFPLKRRQRREPSASPACGRLVYRRPCERRARDRAARRCARRACRRSCSGYPDGNDFNRLRFDSGLKACLRSPARRPLLATDHLALGECAVAARDHPPHLYTPRYLVQELLETAPVSGPGYR